MSSTAPTPNEAQDVVVKRKPGGQPGNRNRFKSGQHSDRNRALRHEIADLKRRTRWTVLLAEMAPMARAGETDTS